MKKYCLYGFALITLSTSLLTHALTVNNRTGSNIKWDVHVDNVYSHGRGTKCVDIKECNVMFSNSVLSSNSYYRLAPFTGEVDTVNTPKYKGEICVQYANIWVEGWEKWNWGEWAKYKSTNINVSLENCIINLDKDWKISFEGNCFAEHAAIQGPCEPSLPPEGASLVCPNYSGIKCNPH